MKILASALALGFLLTGAVQGAEAHPCHRTHGHCRFYPRTMHHHAYRHFVHYPRYVQDEDVAVPPPPPPYYTYPVPPFVLDNPSAPYRNTIQWLMDQENDPPFTSYRYYPIGPR
jgi:hypothetical protein